MTESAPMTPLSASLQSQSQSQEMSDSETHAFNRLKTKI